MRRWLFTHLNAEAWPKSGLSPINLAVMFLIVCAVTLAVLESEPNLKQKNAALFGLTDTLFGFAFLLEYSARALVGRRDYD
jgi:hypothetical protein